MITKFEDIKIGHWITFRSQTKDYKDGMFSYKEKPDIIIERKFYEIVDIKNNILYCKNYNANYSKRPEKFHDTEITDVFKNPDGDEVFENFLDMKIKYAEEFI